MRRMLWTLGLWTLTATGCHDGDAPTVAQQVEAAEAAPEASARDAGQDPRDQYALATAIEQARATRHDLEGTLARTRAAWIGRRYRWEVAFVPALCGTAGACVVMPFDHHHDPDHPIRQGWLPRLELSAEQRASLSKACAEHPQCVVELSGTLGQFELSTEQPTSLTLSDVVVHGSRAAATTESWVRGIRRPAIRRAPRPMDAEATRRMEAEVASGLG